MMSVCGVERHDWLPQCEIYCSVYKVGLVPIFYIAEVFGSVGSRVLLRING